MLPTSPDVVPGQFIVAYEPGSETDARRLIQAEQGLVLRASQTGANFLVAQFADDDSRQKGSSKAQELKCQPFVRYVEPVVRYHACLIPDDSFYAQYQWDRWVMYADRAWERTLGSRNVKVGVVDEGADYTHPDLAASFDPGLKGHDFVDNDADPFPAADSEAHATHVCGIIAAGLNNLIGVAGWANITLYSCRVLDPSGQGTNDNVAEGIRWAANHGCKVINLSLGGDNDSKVLRDAVDSASTKGALVIAASGNEGRPFVYYPAAYDNAIAVGALDVTSVRADFSDYGPQLDLIAPGVDILSSYPPRRYAFASGTSMATPEVAGVAALLLSYRPGLSVRQARAILEAAAVDMGPAGRDDYYGWGLVNADRVLQLAELYSTSDEPTFALPRQAGFPRIVRAGDERFFAALRMTGSEGLRTTSRNVFDAQGRTVSMSRIAHLAPGVYFASDARGNIERFSVIR
jgi:subtilisin family serine protease